MQIVVGGGESLATCWVRLSLFEDLDYAEPMRIRDGMGEIIINARWHYKYISRDGHTGKGINNEM